LIAVWAFGEDDAFAVGQEGVIIHFDGDEWSDLDSNISEDLAAVWGTDEDQVLAVGEDGTILHYDGDTWTDMDGAMSRHLNGLWSGTGVEDGVWAFAVGESGTVVE
ncbi:MAG: glucosyltransferase-I, partial [Chloroflexota bacterium]